jgi:hypothetical protein
MKKVLFSVSVIGTLVLASCGGAAPITESEINAKVDSLAGVKINEMSEKAIGDCEARMTTEVKTLVDSILATKK